MPIPLTKIAKWLDAEIEGDATIDISGLAKIEEAQRDQISFIANQKYEKFLETTRAGAIIVNKRLPASGKTVLRVEDPYFAFMMLAQKFYGDAHSVEKGVHKTAVLGEGTELGEGVAIGAYVVVGKNCRIGKDTILYPGVILGDGVSVGDDCLFYANVSIGNRCQVGQRVILHMGAVIGSDGFGFAFKDDRYHKIPQMGIVVLEDDVEIGANTTIDRATMGETIVRRGTKIDNLVQIAHNVEIGQHTAIAAQAGISGSTKVGNYVRLGGQAGLVGHIEIGDRAAVGAQGGVTKSVSTGTFVSGYPARPHMQVMREEASLGQLPDLIKKVKILEKRIAELEALLLEKNIH